MNGFRTISILAIVLCVCTGVAESVASFLSFSGGGLHPNHPLQFVSLGFSTLAFFSFMAWFFMASRNAHAKATAELRFKPVWTIVGFIVPFLNIIRPYQVMTEIWRVSGARPEALVRIWWFGSIGAMTFSFLLALAIGREQQGATQGFAAAVVACGSILAALVVRRLSVAQVAQQS